MLLQMPQFWEILGYIEDEVQAGSFGAGRMCTTNQAYSISYKSAFVVPPTLPKRSAGQV